MGLYGIYLLGIKRGLLENPPFMDDFPIETSVYMGFPSQPCLITGGYHPFWVPAFVMFQQI